MPPRSLMKKRSNMRLAEERRTKSRHDPGESSTPLVAPNLRLFKYLKIKAVYERDFINKRVAKGKIVTPSICEKHHLNTYKFFDAIGWRPFVSLQKHSYPKIVRIFYAHLEENEESRELLSFAKGKKIWFSKSKLRTQLGLPKGDFQFFQTHNWSHVYGFEPLTAIRQMCEDQSITSVRRVYVNKLAFDARLLHNVITYTILPWSSGRSDVTCMEIFIIWCLLNGKKLDLAHIIYHHMLESKTKAPQCYYASPLTQIFQANQVDLSEEEAWNVGKRDFLDHTTVFLMKMEQDADGHWHCPRAATPVVGECEDDDDEEETNSDEEEEEEAEQSTPITEPVPLLMDTHTSMISQLISHMDDHLAIARRTEKKVDTLRIDIEQFRADYQEDSEATRK